MEKTDHLWNGYLKWDNNVLEFFLVANRVMYNEIVPSREPTEVGSKN